MQPPVPSTVPGSSSVTTPAGVPSRPGLFNGATVHGIPGIRGLRHPAEIPLLIASVLTTLLAYGTWVIIVSWLASSSDATGVEAELRSLFLERGTLSQALLICTTTTRCGDRPSATRFSAHHAESRSATSMASGKSSTPAHTGVGEKYRSTSCDPVQSALM